MSLRADRPNVSRSNSLPEPVSDRLARRPKYQVVLELSLRERLDGSAKEEKNKDPLEKRALAYRTRERDLVTKRINENEKAIVLALRVLAQKATKTCISPVPLCAVIKKRHFENEDEDIPTTLNFKKPRGRTKQLKSLTGYQDTVESLGTARSDPTFKPSTSKFQASGQ